MNCRDCKHFNIIKHYNSFLGGTFLYENCKLAYKDINVSSNGCKQYKRKWWKYWVKQ